MTQVPVPPGLNPREKRPGQPRTPVVPGRPGGPLWYGLAFMMGVGSHDNERMANDHDGAGAPIGGKQRLVIR